MKRFSQWLQKNIKYITLFLVFLVLISIFILIYIIANPTKYEGYTNFRESTLVIATAATVFGTLLLAFATFNLADRSKEQEELRLQEERERENRDRKERWLNEIIEWVISVSSLDSDINRLTDSVRLTIYPVKNVSMGKLHNQTLVLRDRGLYIEKIAIFTKDKTRQSINNLRDELTRIESLFDAFYMLSELGEPPIDSITTEDALLEKRDDNKDTIEGHRKKLSSLCDVIIEEVAKEKVDLINKEELA